MNENRFKQINGIKKETRPDEKRIPICSIQKQDNLCTIAQYKYGGEYSTEGEHVSLFGRVDSIHRLHKFWEEKEMKILKFP